MNGLLRIVLHAYEKAVSSQFSSSARKQEATYDGERLCLSTVAGCALPGEETEGSMSRKGRGRKHAFEPRRTKRRTGGAQTFGETWWTKGGIRRRGGERVSACRTTSHENCPSNDDVPNSSPTHAPFTPVHSQYLPVSPYTSSAPLHTGCTSSSLSGSRRNLHVEMAVRRGRSSRSGEWGVGGRCGGEAGLKV